MVTYPSEEFNRKAGGAEQRYGGPPSQGLRRGQGE